MAEKKELYGYEEDDILTLEFDDGEEEECGILGVFDALGKEYIALNPLGTEDVYPVSYTHLDVYKRQVSGCGCGGSSDSHCIF